jgi:hypothetical protein
MKHAQAALLTVLGFIGIAALIAGIIMAFPGTSGAPGAAPTPTPGPVTGYPAPPKTQSPAQIPTAYPGFAATSYPTPRTAPIVTATSAVPIPADSPDQFDPKTYGLPDMIAGYEALVVVTSKNVACLPHGSDALKWLMLQGAAPTSQAPLTNSHSADEVVSAISALGLNVAEWNISFVGLYTTRAQMIEGYQAFNRQVEKQGCNAFNTTGGPALTQPAQPASTP